MEANLFINCKTLNSVINLYISRLRSLNMYSKFNRDGVRDQIDRDFHQILKEKFNLDSIDDDYVDYSEIVEKTYDLDIQLVKSGHLLWAVGNTYPYRNQLKEMGFHYSPSKGSWFMNPMAEGY